MVHVVDVQPPRRSLPRLRVTFAQTMDGYSLAAIMARMAEEMEAEEQQRSLAAASKLYYLDLEAFGSQ
jgi:hypothetical protein